MLDSPLVVYGANLTGLSGYEEFSRLAVPMFFPYCQIQKGHLIPAQMQHVCDLLWSALGFALMIFLTGAAGDASRWGGHAHSWVV